MQSAPPNAAAVLTPTMCGPTSGFLNTACRLKPASASDPPHKDESRIRGILISYITLRAVASASEPNKILSASSMPT